jgi:hypothetical protein
LSEGGGNLSETRRISAAIASRGGEPAMDLAEIQRIPDRFPP